MESQEQTRIRPPWSDLPGHYTNLSLELPTDLHIDVWLEICSRLTQLTTSSRFWLGDAINHGETIYGEEHYQVFDLIEDKVGRLRDYAYVARQIPPSMREEEVVWTHYRELASIKDTELQFDLLDRIRTEGMTTRQVAEAKRSEEYSKGEKQTMTACLCCYGSGLLLPHKAEQVKRVLAELDYHDELT